MVVAFTSCAFDGDYEEGGHGLKLGWFRCNGARVAITIMKKLEYPLVAVTLTRKQCDEIMSTLCTTSLPKAGYNHNFPRKALHGPTGLMGGEGASHLCNHGCKACPISDDRGPTQLSYWPVNLHQY
jgi:hypothetical protein